MCLTDITLMMALGYFVFSILGVFVNPFFFAMHLYDVVVRNRLLQKVHGGRLMLAARSLDVHHDAYRLVVHR